MVKLSLINTVTKQIENVWFQLNQLIHTYTVWTTSTSENVPTKKLSFHKKMSLIFYNIFF